MELPGFSHDLQKDGGRGGAALMWSKLQHKRCERRFWRDVGLLAAFVSGRHEAVAGWAAK